MPENKYLPAVTDKIQRQADGKRCRAKTPKWSISVLRKLLDEIKGNDKDYAGYSCENIFEFFREVIKSNCYALDKQSKIIGAVHDFDGGNTNVKTFAFYAFNGHIYLFLDNSALNGVAQKYKK